jgi:hypothetical protein
MATTPVKAIRDIRISAQGVLAGSGDGCGGLEPHATNSRFDQHRSSSNRFQIRGLSGTITPLLLLYLYAKRLLRPLYNV